MGATTCQSYVFLEKPFNKQVLQILFCYVIALLLSYYILFNIVCEYVKQNAPKNKNRDASPMEKELSSLHNSKKRN